MSETTIKRDSFYNHDEHGQVLVTSITKMYNEWNTKDQSNNVKKGDVLVHFYTEYDGYGGMIPSRVCVSIDDFAERVEYVEEFERAAP